MAINYGFSSLRRALALIFILSIGCTNMSDTNDTKSFEKGTFGYDHDFLKTHYKNLIVLKGEDSSMVLVSPEVQGRVMTSTARGMQGASYGWINYDLIKSGKFQPKMHAVGGEERIWLGPEGGQFAYYFDPGDAFDLDNWQVPKEIDTEPFDVVSKSAREAEFKKLMSLKNYSGNQFDLLMDRTIKLLTRDEQREYLGMELPASIQSVGIESKNVITNQGEDTWDEDYGMPSIWILSMMNPSPETVIFIPYKKGAEADLGPVVNDTYFGKISEDRLQVNDGMIYFKADGQQRGKIGVSPLRANPIAGSYDAKNQVLTIAMFSLPSGNTQYVNSMWEIQDDPFSGDAVNAYNDGPQDDGSMLGPFYEIESSSPAANLSTGQSLTHYHRTFHFEGDFDELNNLSKTLLGADLNEVKAIF
ncbi:MAG: hypothetical protein KI791_09080 [Cyclobacteriaceae bacterium]|nr:hypothetical protein [Cyclobacteriaceae bacterium SS2]